MGIYNLSKQEIYDAITDVLDSLEGDFTHKQLNEALNEIKRNYKYINEILD